jgi:hypothetical protein
MLRTHFAYRMLYSVVARQDIDWTVGETAKAGPVTHDVENIADPGMVVEAPYLHRPVGV